MKLNWYRVEDALAALLILTILAASAVALARRASVECCEPACNGAGAQNTPNPPHGPRSGLDRGAGNF